MAFQMYDLVTMLDVLYVIKRPNPFWLKFYGRQINFTTDKIAFDRVNADYRRMAPFVVHNVQGKVYTREGYDTVEFAPAYSKPKHIVDPNQILTRQPGETYITGSLSPAQRRDAVIAEILDRHTSMHLMTQEWLAARALIDGEVTIQGDDYPLTLVDFRRDPSLTVILAGGAKWDQTTANPLNDIYATRNDVRVLCGATVTDIIFGRDAWAQFIARTDVKALLNTLIRGSETTISLVIDNFEDAAEFLGELRGSGGNGSLRLWLYSGKFRDQAGVLQDLLDPGTVVGIAPSAFAGVRCFGAIKDADAEFQALEIFPKLWRNEDPPCEYLMSQSAPLMVPGQPNASFSLKVV